MSRSSPMVTLPPAPTAQAFNGDRNYYHAGPSVRLGTRVTQNHRNRVKALQNELHNLASSIDRLLPLTQTLLEELQQAYGVNEILRKTIETKYQECSIMPPEEELAPLEDINPLLHEHFHYPSTSQTLDIFTQAIPKTFDTEMVDNQLRFDQIYKSTKV